MFLIPARFTFGADFLLLSSPTGVLSTQIILQSRVTRVTFHKTGETIITLMFLKPASYLLGYLSYDASRCLKHYVPK